MYATANLYDKYKNDAVNTASPIDLIIMLYDGCIKQIKFAGLYMEEKNIEMAGKAILKAEDIIDELMRSLDMSVEMSRDLLLLYDFINHELIQLNVTKDMTRAEPILQILEDLRDAWKGVKASVSGNVYYEDD